jgi:hypothetical protein
MGILKLKTRVSALSGSAITNAASVASTIEMFYDTNAIVWPTLASASGSLIQSTFEYALPSGAVGHVFVNHTASAIGSAAGASALA